MLTIEDYKAPIIFVWIGDLPGWVGESLSFSRKNNKSRDIYLLTDSSLVPVHCEIIARVVKIKASYIARINNKLPNLEFSGNFWKRCSLRFFVLEDFVRKKNIKEFFHAELDNALFDLGYLSNKFIRIGKGLFVPRDSESRAIASLIYCNRIESLSEFTDLYTSSNPPNHDMAALGIYSDVHSKYFYALPTESFINNSSRWPLVSPQKVSGIFDAAAIGQYILGVDPIHCQFKPCWNGFVNENCNIDLNSVIFFAEDSRIFIQYKASGIKFQIYNIHLHSKNWKAFHTIMLNGDVLKKLNNGDKSIISNHLMILVGPIFSVIYRFSTLLLRMYKFIIREIF